MGVEAGDALGNDGNVSVMGSLTHFRPAGWLAGRVVARAGLEGQPRSFLATGALWPDWLLRPNAPVTIVYTIEIVRRLKASIADRGWSSTAAAEQIGMSRQSLQRILASEVVPDLHTLARAESSLGVRLWPV